MNDHVLMSETVRQTVRSDQYILKEPKDTVPGAADIHIAGIMGDGPNFESIAPEIGIDRNMYRVSYDGDQFTPDKITDSLADDCERLLDQHGSLNLIGSSMGGYVTIDIAKKLRARGRAETINGIFVDTLSGPRSVRLRESIGLHAFQLLRINGLLESFPWLSPLVTKVARTVAVKPSKKDTEDGVNHSEAYDATVQNLRNGAGSGQRIAGMVPYMFSKPRVGINDMQDESGENLFNEIHYISCHRHNVTVKQPRAQRDFAHAGATIHEINAAHCSYQWQPEIWKKAFSRIFSHLDYSDVPDVDNTISAV